MTIVFNSDRGQVEYVQLVREPNHQYLLVCLQAICIFSGLIPHQDLVIFVFKVFGA